ncbi:uncharacterized protein TM35_001161000, partial [Trypanosoma theileri]
VKKPPHDDEQTALQPDHNRVSVGNGSEPAGSEGPGSTSSTAGTVDSERSQQNTQEGQAKAPPEGTTSSGDGGSNNTNLQTPSEGAD